jgi:hypothetical protein
MQVHAHRNLFLLAWLSSLLLYHLGVALDGGRPRLEICLAQLLLRVDDLSGLLPRRMLLNRCFQADKRIRLIRS